MARQKSKGEGVIALPHFMLRHEAFLGLSAQAKVLMLLLQSHWSTRHPARPIGYGIEQAEANIPCSRHKAVATFKELQEAGFIEQDGDYLFMSNGRGRVRAWRITWASCKGYSATHKWRRQK